MTLTMFILLPAISKIVTVYINLSLKDKIIKLRANSSGSFHRPPPIGPRRSFSSSRS